MKFFIQKEIILPGLQQAAQITPLKTGAVYLRSVWLKAEGDHIQVMATDANIEYFGQYSAQVETDGIVGVNGRHLYDLIRKLHPGELLFQVEEESKKLVIKQNKKKYVLPINENYWFQPLSVFPEENSVFWHGEVFTDIIESIAFSVSDDDDMRAINCMLIKYSENKEKIEFCGMNGHQLALHQLEKNGLEVILPEQGILIMKKYLIDLKRIVPAKEIQINVSNNRLYARSVDKMECVSIPLCQYEYPDHNELLAKYVSDNPSNMVVEKSSLMDALDRISIFNTESSICTFFEFSGDVLQMDVNSDEKGEAKEYIDVKFDGDLKRIAFPTKDIMDILSHFKSGELHFHFTSSEKPCFVTGKDDHLYSVLIMPMKISEDVVYTETDV